MSKLNEMHGAAVAKFAVRPIADTGAQDYQSLYGDCPESFTDRAEAQKWATELSTSGEWPQGNPGYHVVEL